MAGESPRIDLATSAADQVIDETPISFEPTNAEEARAAVERLNERFAALPGSILRAFGTARSSGTLLSSDRLQGLAEIVQNADDVEASEVRFLLRPTDLLVSHNGTPVCLADVQALATPWLTTKADDATTTGRFGIGLSALQSLSTTLEVHCAPYHVRIGDPFVAPVESTDLPGWFAESGWTTLRVPLVAEQLQSADLETWLSRWDDSALLFLRHVDRVTLLDPDGQPIRELELSRRGGEGSMPASRHGPVSRQFADTADGRSWAVYSAQAPSPDGAERAQKATGSSTPIAVACPLDTAEAGQLYAGLPVAPTRTPLFANAQFDPLTSRTGLADTDWNRALVGLVADVWVEAVLDLFGRSPAAGWQAMPLPSASNGEVASGVVHAIEAAVLDRARQQVASRLSFPVAGQGQVSLSHLAVEAPPLEGILEESEIAELAGLGATLPGAARDPAGRWRTVLDDWRSHGTDLPGPVSVRRALDLVGDEGRPADSTIALVAVALHGGLGERLLELPCVTAHDGRRIVPPSGTSPAAVSVGAVPLAGLLGITTVLHPAHLADTEAARKVLDWLRECGALLDGAEDGAVVRRLAKAGQSGSAIDLRLTDEQVQALRDAFACIPRADQDKLGPDVGLAVFLASYTYDADGHKQTGAARPADAYLSRAIDGQSESFAAAADKTQGLVWLSSHYATALRSQAGHEGLGALRFLRLLGAETAPRLQPHLELCRRYSRHYNDNRKGLPRDVESGPETRRLKMQEVGATYTLDDHDSPDLIVVIADISEENDGERRRKRTGALLAALGRAWDRRLSDFTEVEAVSAHYGWNHRGRIPAFWLAQARDIAWLDDASGTARKPAALRVRTPATLAIHGERSPDYLHADLRYDNRPDTWRELLTALGVASNPSRSELVSRLRELRRVDSEAGISQDDLRHASALVYQALAQSLDGVTVDSDLTSDQIRQEFVQSDLLYTDLGWLSPRAVLSGDPIFGSLRAFAPKIRGCKPLWDALRLSEPSPEDCLEVLRRIASRRKTAPDEQEVAILLETMRLLARHHSGGRTVERRQLAGLSLWTSMGWTRKRPVYATDDPDLRAGLGDRLPVWQPGGILDQFRSVLEPLRVTEIRVSEAEVVSPELARDDHASTEAFQAAVKQLQSNMQRNAPELIDKLTVPLDALAEYAVRVHPSLALSIHVGPVRENCAVKAMVDPGHASVFLVDREQLARMNGAGRALARLLKGNENRLASEWRAAWEQVEDGLQERRIELARERAAREEMELEGDTRIVDLQERIARPNRSSSGSAGQATSPHQPPSGAEDEREPASSSPPVTSPRTLVDPRSLELANPKGLMNRGSPDTSSDASGGVVPTRFGRLYEPRGGSPGPQVRTPPPEYTDLDREDVGLELLRMVLGGDADEIVDLRTQRGVGADAIDHLRNFYELKVHAGPEPNEVKLTNSEVQRALVEPKFFLVVVSNVEKGSDAPPTVRLIVDPLKQLRPTDRGEITLSGVSEAQSLVYEFAQIDDQELTERIDL